MDENSARTAPLDLRRLFLWTQLFRAFRIALDIRKALLAAVALLAIAKGDELILSLPFASDYPQLNKEIVWPADEAVPFTEPPLRNPVASLETVAQNGMLIFKPLAIFVEPARALLSPRTTLTQATTALTRLLWAMLVWSLFGGAITRMAAVEFARDERHGMRAALKFSAKKILSFLGAPLLPIGGIALFWVLGMLVGLFARIPGAGEIIVGAGFVVPLIFGLVMALIILAVGVGWPLMFATISTEGTDGFDGFSRSFSYVFGRPWHYLWYAAVSLAYGFLITCFVLVVATLAVYLTGWTIESGLGYERVLELMHANPNLTGGPMLFAPTPGTDLTAIQPAGDSLGAQFAGLWLQFLAILIAGFVYSYFWSSATITYFLLRKVDDATALDEVYLAAEDDEDELLPLVGVAASDQPVVERPANVEGINEPSLPDAKPDEES